MGEALSRELWEITSVLKYPLGCALYEFEGAPLHGRVRRLGSNKLHATDMAIMPGARKKYIKRGIRRERERQCAEKTACAHVFGRCELFKRAMQRIGTLQFQREMHSHADVRTALHGPGLQFLG